MCNLYGIRSAYDILTQERKTSKGNIHFLLPHSARFPFSSFSFLLIPHSYHSPLLLISSNHSHFSSFSILTIHHSFLIPFFSFLFLIILHSSHSPLITHFFSFSILIILRSSHSPFLSFSILIILHS